MKLSGIGSGIQMPKLTNRFIVQFFEKGTDTREARLAALEQQVINFDIPTTSFDDGFTFDKSGWFMFEDDIRSLAAKAVFEFGRQRRRFDILVSLMDGNDQSFEQIKFTNVVIEECSLSKLDYACVPDRAHFNLAFNPSPSAMNAINKMPNGDEVLSVLGAIFNSLTVTLDDSRGYAPVIQRCVSFSYEEMTHIFSGE